MKILNFYLPEPQRAGLVKLSKKLDVSVAELIRRAIAKYLENQK